MNTFRCLACGGTYTDTDSAGSSYAHACGQKMDAQGNAVEVDNRRDENPVFNSSGRLVGMKSPGAGVVCLNDPKVTNPKWFTDLQKLDAKKDAAENALDAPSD
jgi:hypothetical protein